MFCCGVCKATFTGIYQESVFATPCGHLFHAECLRMCFNKQFLNQDDELNCPFCTIRVDTTKMIKLHFQIDANWKDTAAALTKQANKRIMNLDESLKNSSIMYSLFNLVIFMKVLIGY